MTIMRRENVIVTVRDAAHQAELTVNGYEEVTKKQLIDEAKKNQKAQQKVLITTEDVQVEGGEG